MGGVTGRAAGGVKKGRPQDGPRPRTEVGGSAFGRRADSSIGRTRVARGVLSWGQTACVDTASRIHRRKRGNPRGLGRGAARRRWRAGAGVHRSETPSKHVRPARRGRRAGGPQHRGRGALEEAGAEAGMPPCKGLRHGWPPADGSPLCEEPPAVTGAGPGGFKPGLFVGAEWGRGSDPVSKCLQHTGCSCPAWGLSVPFLSLSPSIIPKTTKANTW